jgi:glutaredoxin
MKIEIYGASWCTTCKDAVAFCKNKSISYNYIDIDNTSNLRVLEERVGSKVRSVPQIFLDDRHVGGFVAMMQEVDKT